METSKKIILFLVVAAIIGGGYYFLFSNSNADQLATKVKVSRGDIIAKDLADKYQAATGWEENIIYTLHAQDRLITGKPTLFRGYVYDVFRRDGKIFVVFSTLFSTRPSTSQFHFVLELECNQQVVEKIFSQKIDDKISLNFFDEYAIVANIQEITKPVFALEGSALSEYGVEINTEPSNPFIAKGGCVDVAHIGDDELSND